MKPQYKYEVSRLGRNTSKISQEKLNQEAIAKNLKQILATKIEHR